MTIVIDSQLAASRWYTDILRQVAIRALSSISSSTWYVNIVREVSEYPFDDILASAHTESLMLPRMVSNYPTDVQITKEEAVDRTINRIGIQHPIYTAGTAYATGGGMITYVKKRARDSGAPGPIYVTWVTNVVSQPYPYPPPYGGPLVDIIIAELWQV